MLILIIYTSRRDQWVLFDKDMMFWGRIRITMYRVWENYILNQIIVARKYVFTSILLLNHQRKKTLSFRPPSLAGSQQWTELTIANSVADCKRVL